MRCLWFIVHVQLHSHNTVPLTILRGDPLVFLLFHLFLSLSSNSLHRCLSYRSGLKSNACACVKSREIRKKNNIHTHTNTHTRTAHFIFEKKKKRMYWDQILFSLNSSSTEDCSTNMHSASNTYMYSVYNKHYFHCAATLFIFPHSEIYKNTIGSYLCGGVLWSLLEFNFVVFLLLKPMNTYSLGENCHIYEYNCWRFDLI